MNRERLLNFYPLLLVLFGFVLEVLGLALRIFLGYPGNEGFTFGMSLMLLGLTALVLASALQRQAGHRRTGTPAEGIRRPAGGSGNCFGRRVGAFERELDEARASAVQPKP